jgi:hypothetical protein
MKFLLWLEEHEDEWLPTSDLWHLFPVCLLIVISQSHIVLSHVKTDSYSTKDLRGSSGDFRGSSLHSCLCLRTLYSILKAHSDCLMTSPISSTLGITWLSLGSSAYTGNWKCSSGSNLKQSQCSLLLFPLSECSPSYATWYSISENHCF